MTAYFAASDDTLAHARDDYFRVNGFGANGGYDDAWVDFKLGPIPMPFPNTPSRKRAVRFHDLHHALTGYATDVRGEFEISAWEIGSGCAEYDDALLGRRIGDVRAELGLDAAPAPARAADVAWFALASLAGLAIGTVMLVLMVPAAIVANLAALFRRR
jgi:hypothetical protein